MAFKTEYKPDIHTCQHTAQSLCRNWGKLWRYSLAIMCVSVSVTFITFTKFVWDSAFLLMIGTVATVASLQFE
jgi:hypothetical protein